MKYLPPESPLRRLIEINTLDAETCEQIIREVEQYVVDRYETIEPRLRLSVTVTIPAEHSISGAAFSFAVHYDDYAHSWAKQVYAALLGHTPTVDEIDEAISAGHNAHASMRRTTDADRDRDCSLDMAVSYGLDCTSEEERREDYYSVRGLK